ncbi:MAG: hypothetical protein QM754_00815 [Tepidisphaeraceae bacterium]
MSVKPLKPAAVLALLFPYFAFAAVPTTNPADLDRAAINLMETGNDHDLIAESPDSVYGIPLDEKAADYLKRRKPGLDLLRQATTMPAAEWEPVDADLSKVIRSLSGFRWAAQVTWLSSRYQMSQAHPGEAVDDLLAGFAVGRHLGQRPLLITRLTMMAIESESVDQLAALLPKLPPDVAKKLPAKFDALPKPATLADVFEGERQLAPKLYDQQFATLPAAKRAKSKALLDGVAPLYDAIKAASDKSPADFDKAIDDAMTKLKGNPFAETLVPGLKRIHDTDARIQAKTAMLRTAIAITADGPGALEKSKDPFGMGPFVRSDTAKGYTLTSALPPDRNGPVSLTIAK